jgi:7,8-dihydropterin-6-yl-methyl-4-(beta-D-ribofuranosyl)aminobenzene 5'-phosphate synthase
VTEARVTTTAELTVLSENCAARRGLLGEHGLAIWVETEGHRILFDTGQGLALRHNAAVLSVDLSSADTLVLSHGHYDHTGGLAAGDCFSHTQVLVHPAAFGDKYAGPCAERARGVGSGLASAEDLRSAVGSVVLTPTPTQIGPGVWVTGEIPRHTEFEDTGGPFFLDSALTVPDPLADDQALFFSTRAGTVVLLGCAHAGIVNTLDYVAKLTGEQQIHGVFGGLHLLGASAARTQATIDALRRHQVQRVGPAHCTGLMATAIMLSAFPRQFVELGAGTHLSL